MLLADCRHTQHSCAVLCVCCVLCVQTHDDAAMLASSVISEPARARWSLAPAAASCRRSYELVRARTSLYVSLRQQLRVRARTYRRRAAAWLPPRGRIAGRPR
eukprot:COSAG01_NODE_1209_length_11232_cov_5.378818_5_plen_103_part_00